MDKNSQAVSLFDKKAQLYQDKYMDVSLYHESLDLFCQKVQGEAPEILELACGPGNISKYLLDQRPDFQLLGTDLSPNMIKLAKVNNPQADFELLDVRKIKQLGKKYEGLVCGFVFPYLSKEEAIGLIEDAYATLKEAGVLYISTMEDDYEKSTFQGPSSGEGEKIFIHYHQADYVQAALEQSGFREIDYLKIKFPVENGPDTWDMVFIAKK